jgi:hypothetical protein
MSLSPVEVVVGDVVHVAVDVVVYSLSESNMIGI